MMITLDWLKKYNAPDDVISFITNNRLIGFPLVLLNEIKQDHDGIFTFIKKCIENTYTFNDDGKVSYCKEFETGFEYWLKYDAHGNLIQYWDSDDFEYNQEYDANGNMIFYWDSNNFAFKQEFDSDNRLVRYRDSRHFEYQLRYIAGILRCYKDSKKYEAYLVHDEQGNLVYKKYSNGYVFWQTFDDHNNMVLFKNNKGHSTLNEVEYYDDGQLKNFNKLEIPWFPKH